MMVTSTVIELDERYSGDQIVVDLADCTYLVADLGRMGIEVHVEDTVEALDVALLALPDLVVDDLPDVETVRAELTAVRREAGRRGSPSPLELLMAVLRRRFAARFGRMPQVGKNRDMELMEGLPHLGGGEGLPRPAATIDIDRRTSVRGRGVRVGILDTAMFPNAELQGRYLSDDLVTGGPPRHTWAGHAAFVAGRILQRAPGAELDVRQVLSDDTGTASSWAVAERMASFLGSGVEVLNLSLGGFTADDQPPFLMVRAVERLAVEMVLVAAAGNHGNDPDPTPDDSPGTERRWRTGPTSNTSPIWPAALDDVVAVGAANVELVGNQFVFTPADFTPPGVTWIHLWAPGADVVSTYLTGEVTGSTVAVAAGVPVVTAHPRVFDGFARWSGTSFAAGDVTGEIASMAQRDGVSARAALASIVARPAKGTDFDIRPVGS